MLRFLFKFFENNDRDLREVQPLEGILKTQVFIISKVYFFLQYWS